VQLSVVDYAKPEDAIGAALDGDRVYFPAYLGPYVPPPGGYKITKSIEIFGDGAGASDNVTGTLFQPNADNSDVFVVDPSAAAVMVRFRGFTVTTGGAAGGSAIACRISGTQNNVRALVVERVSAFNLAGDLIHFEGAALDNSTVERAVISDCSLSFGLSLGVFLKNVRSYRLTRCAIIANPMGGVYAELSCGVLYIPDFDGNGKSRYATQGTVRSTNSKLISLDAPHVEDFQNDPQHGGAGSEGAFLENSSAAVVLGGLFTQHNPHRDSTGVRVSGPSAGPVALLGNRFERVYPAILDLGSGESCMLSSQFSDLGGGDPAPGTISFPSDPNSNLGMAGHAAVVVSDPNQDKRCGLVIPSGNSLPAVGLSDGMLFYLKTNPTTPGALKARVGGAWKTVQFL